MTTQMTFASTANAVPLGRERVPLLAFEDFQRRIADAVVTGARVAALFADAPATGGPLSLYVVLADDTAGRLRLAQAQVAGESGALAAAHQRAIAEAERIHQALVEAKGVHNTALATAAYERAKKLAQLAP